MKKQEENFPQNADIEYLSDPESLNPGYIEWEPDSIEVDYGTFYLQTLDGKVWEAISYDEENYPDPVTIEDPEEGIYYTEPVTLFGEYTLSVDEFQLLRNEATNIMTDKTTS